MRIWRAVLTACLLHAAGGMAFGDSPSEVVTDRLDVADSTQTVPFGAFQLETGLEYARTRLAGIPDERRFAVQALLRAGLTDRLEVRLEGEPLIRSLDTGGGYLVTQRIALDAAIQTSLIGRAPDYAFRAGATVRFGR